MPMVRHHAPSENSHRQPLFGLVDSLLERLEVSLFPENARPPDGPIVYVIRITPVGESQSSWHDQGLSIRRRCVKRKDSRPLYLFYLFSFPPSVGYVPLTTEFRVSIVQLYRPCGIFQRGSGRHERTRSFFVKRFRRGGVSSIMVVDRVLQIHGLQQTGGTTATYPNQPSP